jgi:hypothetical protein
MALETETPGKWAQLFDGFETMALSLTALSRNWKDGIFHFRISFPHQKNSNISANLSRTTHLSVILSILGLV